MANANAGNDGTAELRGLGERIHALRLDAREGRHEALALRAESILEEITRLQLDDPSLHAWREEAERILGDEYRRAGFPSTVTDRLVALPAELRIFGFDARADGVAGLLEARRMLRAGLTALRRGDRATASVTLEEAERLLRAILDSRPDCAQSIVALAHLREIRRRHDAGARFSA